MLSRWQKKFFSNSVSFAGVARASVQELAKIHGVGLTKAIQLAASFALGARWPKNVSLLKPWIHRRS